MPVDAVIESNARRSGMFVSSTNSLTQHGRERSTVMTGVVTVSTARHGDHEHGDS